MPFGFRKHKDKLKLGTGARSVIRSTKSSDALAEEILLQAQTEAKYLPSGQEFTIEITADHQDVHHMELLLSLMTLAPNYGLQAGTQFNNQQTFIKV